MTARWLVLALLAVGCRPASSATDGAPTPPTDAKSGDFQSVYDHLEALIAEGNDSEDDREDALERMRAIADDGSAAYAFARAAVLGRVAELRGVKAGKLVTEAEHWAKTSVDRDPAYRDKAATRMLGSLWVMAPARLVEHGDSEQGLEVLEGLAKERPDDPQNHLRVAEAYVFLGDPEPARPHLCLVKPKRDALRPDEGALFDKLVEEAADGQELVCEGAQ